MEDERPEPAPPHGLASVVLRVALGCVLAANAWAYFARSSPPAPQALPGAGLDRVPSGPPPPSGAMPAQGGPSQAASFPPHGLPLPPRAFEVPTQPGPCCLPVSIRRDQDPDRSRGQALLRFVGQYPEVLLRPDAFASGVCRLPSLEVLGVGPHDTILDLGCGCGALEMRMLREGTAFGRLMAVDQEEPSVDFLQHALQLVPVEAARRMEARVGDGTCIDLPEGSTDLAILFNVPVGVSEQLRGASDPRRGRDARALAELRRVLKPGGRIYLRVKRNLCASDVVTRAYTEAGFRVTTQEPDAEATVLHLVRP